MAEFLGVLDVLAWGSIALEGAEVQLLTSNRSRPRPLIWKVVAEERVRQNRRYYGKKTWSDSDVHFRQREDMK